MSDGYTYDPTDMTSTTTSLHDVSDTLSQRAPQAKVSPDAGRSSTEVAAAFSAFAEGVAALSRSLAAASTTVGDSLDSYVTADEAAAREVRGAGGSGPKP